MLVVMNEAAGRTVADSVDPALAELRKAGEVEVAELPDESDPGPILDRRNGRTLVVVGGDGTLHAVIGALWRRGESSACPVGVIPLGTGNDFARGCGIPLDPREAAQLIVHGEPRPVDLISDDDGRVVVNAVHLGVGADAAVVARPMKRYFKIGAFPLGGLLAGVRAKGWRLRVEVDSATVIGPASMLMVGISNASTIAGGTAQLAPNAVPTDGMFDVTVWRRAGLLKRIGFGIGLVAGTHHRRAGVRQLRGRTASVTGEPFHINADGEVAGAFTHLTWAIQPGAWRCFLPAPAGAKAGRGG